MIRKSALFPEGLRGVGFYRRPILQVYCNAELGKFGCDLLPQHNLGFLYDTKIGSRKWVLLKPNGSVSGWWTARTYMVIGDSVMEQEAISVTL